MGADGRAVGQAVQYALGVALVLAAVGLVAKAWTARRQPAGPGAPVTVRPLPTLLLGAVGGLVVGLTSVG